MSRSVIILTKRDNARRVKLGFGGDVDGIIGSEAVAGAFLMVFIPEIAAFPDAGAYTGERADGDSVVYHFPVLIGCHRRD